MSPEKLCYDKNTVTEFIIANIFNYCKMNIMNSKPFRRILFFLIFVLAALLALIGINKYSGYFGKNKPEQKRDRLADESLKGIYTLPVIRSKIVEGGLPQDKYEYSSTASASGSVDMLVPSEDFEFDSVAEKRKDMFEVLAEKEKESKEEVISLDEEDLARRIYSSAAAQGDVHISTAIVPEMGRGAANEGVSMISVQLGYKIYTDGEVWAAFASSHKIKLEVDFKKDNVVILVPLEDIPPGMLKIKDIEYGQDGTAVKYTVNPMVMTEYYTDAQREAYSAAKISKNAGTVRLLQVKE